MLRPQAFIIIIRSLEEDLILNVFEMVYMKPRKVDENTKYQRFIGVSDLESCFQLMTESTKK
jgi:hypothetical protein